MSLTFNTKIGGIPCQCEVTFYSPPSPMRITGTGYGDAEPPEYEEFEFTVLDRKGYKAPWLQRKLTSADASRLTEEAKAATFADKYGVDF